MITISKTAGDVGKWSLGERFSFNPCGPGFINRRIEGINVFIHMDGDSAVLEGHMYIYIYTYVYFTSMP